MEGDATMEWAYVAGYFDGEGTVNFHDTARGGKTRAIAWFNTHEDSLRAMREFMGVGKVLCRGRHSGFGGKKIGYVLKISRKADMLYAIDNMLPHLLIKRARAEALRDYLIDHVDETRMVNFGKVAAVSTEQLREWYDRGESLGDIASRLGVGYAAVGQAFRLRGIPRRDQSIATSMKQKGVPKSPETRARMIEAQRKRWADAAVAERQKALMMQPERRQRMADGLRAKWSDPEYHARMKAVRQAQWADPKNRAAMSAAQRKRRDAEKAARAVQVVPDDRPRICPSGE
jgi:hypothetical protein